MGEQAERIERRIEEQRSEVRDNLLAIQQTVSRSVDWRAQVELRPLTMVGLAFGAGVLMSAVLGAKARPDFNRMSSSDAPRAAQPSLGGTWEILSGAVIGLAVTRLREFAEELLPGFQEEYTKAEAGRRAS
jgi:hypothetical protein